MNTNLIEAILKLSAEEQADLIAQMPAGYAVYERRQFKLAIQQRLRANARILTENCARFGFVPTDGSKFVHSYDSVKCVICGKKFLGRSLAHMRDHQKTHNPER